MSNGLIGFAENSKDIDVDEDLDLMATLTLTRLNAFYGDVSVSWVAEQSESCRTQNEVVLALQLQATTGVTTCPADVSICYLQVPLMHDTVS